MKFSTITALLFTQAGLSLAAPSNLATPQTPAVAKTAAAIESKTGSNGIETPLPIQPGMVDNCDRFRLVKKGENCDDITYPAGITFDQFKKWNPTIGDECLSLWADANVCIRTIGYEYPTYASCYLKDSLLQWGKNKAAALDAVSKWCVGGQGKPIYEIGQEKTACYDAPSGDGKFLFEVYNGHRARAALVGNECKAALALSINECAKGGQGTVKHWVTQATFEKGKC